MALQVAFTKKNSWQYLPILLGPLLFVLVAHTGLLPLEKKVSTVIGITTWMLTWWITEIIPVAVTALLPIVLFPGYGVLNAADTVSNYANATIFMYMSGFILALAVEKHQLHVRIALHIVRLIGTKPHRLVLGFMVATAFVSMWVNNTAALLLMFPIATSVLELMKVVFDEKGLDKSFVKFAASMLLGIAYSASIGGITTIVGTPTNTVLIAFFKQAYHQDISFVNWFIVGFPLGAFMLLAAYWIIVKWLFKVPNNNQLNAFNIIDNKITALGKISYQEYAVSSVFVITAFGWVFRSLISGWFNWPFLNDTTIGLFGVFLLFVTPDKKSKTGFLMDWDSMTKLSWGILLLIGGGLTLAKAFENSGLIKLVGNAIAGSNIHNYVLLLVIVVSVTLLLKQFIGNTALASIAIPMVVGIASATNIAPILLAAPVGFAASFAFMLPMSTPPNAIVFSTGYITTKNMVYAGLLLTIVGSLLLVLFAGCYHWLL